MIPPLLRRLALGVALPAALLFTGCATTQVSYLTTPGAAAKVAAFKAPTVAPLKVEVFELSAGGVREKRDDWSTQAARDLTGAVGARSGFHTVTAATAGLDADGARELAEVQALLQAITINHAFNSLLGPAELRPAARPLSYNVGRIDHLLDKLQADCLLFANVHDEYSTGGRKALMALGVLASAVTGVVIVPAGGTTLNSAALVERDGSVLWFNCAHGGGDLRTTEGAGETIKVLLAGLPGAAGPVAATGTR